MRVNVANLSDWKANSYGPISPTDVMKHIGARKAARGEPCGDRVYPGGMIIIDPHNEFNDLSRLKMMWMLWHH